jgi:hypothetical protein
MAPVKTGAFLTLGGRQRGRARTGRPPKKGDDDALRAAILQTMRRGNTEAATVPNGNARFNAAMRMIVSRPTMTLGADSNSAASRVRT